MAAYDLGELVDELKVKGLDLAEDAAKIAVEGVLDWVAKSAIKSENKFDDVVAALAPIMKQELLKLVDKIDGEEG